MRRLADRLLDGRVLGSAPPDPPLDSLVSRVVSEGLSAGALATWSALTGPDYTQATGTAQPTVTLDVLSGYPAVRFDGTSDYVVAGSLALNQPFTVAALARNFDVLANDRQLVSARNTANQGQAAGVTSHNSSGQFAVFAGSILSSTVSTDTAWHAFVSVFNGGSSVARVDATEAAGSAGTRNATIFTIGAANLSGGVSQFWSGDVVEVLAWDKALSLAERDAAVEYFTLRYAY